MIDRLITLAYTDPVEHVANQPYFKTHLFGMDSARLIATLRTSNNWSGLSAGA